ncbi:NLGN4X [Branchiostoma lanceolatum]|uniref:NLGN4X protein n=1 Tax=Branchiostoma lanceolatum TaxID=7740 RepID=A0A8J9YZA4_BRALA|nr:NLGN4X [Branchiostoma lanceolatum]
MSHLPDKLSLPFVVLLSIVCTAPMVHTREPVVRIGGGEDSPTLRGTLVNLDNSDTELVPVEKYLGIPYAEPPTGMYRFKQAKLQAPNWTGARNATSFGPACMQAVRKTTMTTPSWTRQQVASMQPYLQTLNEDCLFLNIYRPINKGFLSTEDSNAQGNYGLSDQIKALEWVNSYISFFGGNPHNIVIFGSGTGAASVHLLMLSPKARNKFRRGISMSGSALATWAMSRNGRVYATAAAKQVGCDNSDTKTMVDCLRGKSADVLANISTSIVEPSRYYFAFAPVVDYLIIPNDPTRLTTKNMSNLPHDYMVGVTESDGFMYVDGVKGVGDDGINKDDFEGLVDNFVQQVFQSRQPEIKDAVTFSYTDWSDRNNDIKRRKSTVALFTDYFFVQPAVTTLNAIAPVLKGNTYFYAFLYRGEVGFGPDWAAAVHGEELPFIFGAPVGTQLGKGALYSFSNFTNQDNMYSVALMTYWTNFAKTGNPNLPGMQKPSFLGIRPNKFEGVVWPRYTRENQDYLYMAMRPRQRDNYRANKLMFWIEWLPKVQVPSQMATPPGQPDLSKCPNYPPTRGTSVRWRPRPGPDVLIGRGTKSPPVQSSSRELNVTIAVGASLLLINIIVFIVVNYRRIDCAAYRRRKKRTDKKKKLNANHSGSIPSVRILEIGPPIRGQDLMLTPEEPSGNSRSSLDYYHPNNHIEQTSQL